MLLGTSGKPSQSDISQEQEGGREDGLVRWGVLSKVPTGMRPPGTAVSCIIEGLPVGDGRLQTSPSLDPAGHETP